MNTEPRDLVVAGRSATVNRTDDVSLALAKAWVRAWDELAPYFEDALERLTTSGGEDGMVDAATVAKDQRVTQAMARAQRVLEDLAEEAEATITAEIGPVVLGAADTQYAALQAQLPDDAPGVAGLGRLDDGALDEIVARTTENIHSALLPLAVEAVDAMRRELVRGISTGDNPRTVARRIMARTEGRFAGGLARAERIARTEMLDAHRATDQAVATQNRHLIAAQVWHATLDRRTCPSCLGMHGVEFPPTAFGPEDHPQGRCVFVPRTKTWAELGLVGLQDQQPDYTGERDTWWDNLTKQSQDAVLGKDRADLIRNGDATWTDLATRRENPDWRASYTMTPLNKLGA